MQKRDERDESRSCWNKAREDEHMFILLERDQTTPEVIRIWATLRVEKGLNQPDDEQITEALESDQYGMLDSAGDLTLLGRNQPITRNREALRALR